MSMFLKHKLVK